MQRRNLDKTKILAEVLGVAYPKFSNLLDLKDKTSLRLLNCSMKELMDKEYLLMPEIKTTFEELHKRLASFPIENGYQL